jgi:hypothetical protein
MTGNRAGMVSREKMPAERCGYHNEGKDLAPVAHGLHSTKLPMEHTQHAVIMEERAVGAADCIEGCLIP